MLVQLWGLLLLLLVRMIMMMMLNCRRQCNCFSSMLTLVWIHLTNFTGRYQLIGLIHRCCCSCCCCCCTHRYQRHICCGRRIRCTWIFHFYHLFGCAVIRCGFKYSLCVCGNYYNCTTITKRGIICTINYYQYNWNEHFYLETLISKGSVSSFFWNFESITKIESLAKREKTPFRLFLLLISILFTFTQCFTHGIIILDVVCVRIIVIDDLSFVSFKKKSCHYSYNSEAIYTVWSEFYC